MLTHPVPVVDDPTAVRCFHNLLTMWKYVVIFPDFPHLLIIYILMFEPEFPTQITSGIIPVLDPALAILFLKCHRPCLMLSVELVAVPVALDPVGIVYFKWGNPRVSGWF